MSGAALKEVHPVGSRAALLVELFVEELPPKALKQLGESFAALLFDRLKTQGLTSDDSAATPYASPRRLAVHISAVLKSAVDRSVTVKLMPVGVGFDAEGRPTAALLKRLAAFGADESIVSRLERRSDGKSEALFFERHVKGATLTDGLQTALAEAVARLPIPKLMEYQLADGWTTVRFVRPAHGLVALHGADVVPVTVLGLSAGRETHGHRFEAALDPVVLQNADHYAPQLDEQGAVIASFTSRRADIFRQLEAAASKEALTVADDPALLDEVTALVERPNVLLCRFEAEFLAVPPECLILTMKANQKYFPLLDANGKLTNRFLVVSNIRPDDPSRVIEGNERVVRPRLADARFFFDQDRKRTLESRVADLGNVVYHNKLGSQGARSARVRTIAAGIAGLLDPGFGGAALMADVERAARLAKADLLTDMVGEFPELQGVMGRYYALHDGEREVVADAIEDHYKPRFAGDMLPRGEVGIVVALADKLETLVGLFGIGQLPTGDKDPFALRRHALGVIRILTGRGLDLLKIELPALVQLAVQAFGSQISDPSTALLDFIYDRFAGSLREKGYSAGEVDAVLSVRPPWLEDVETRLMAVRAFAALPEAAALAAANKRVGNILGKSRHSGVPAFDPALLVEPGEIELYRCVVSRGAVAQTFLNSGVFSGGDHTAALLLMAELRPSIDAFFETVMVNTDDAVLRANRLGLLAMLHATMNRVADLSKLAS